MRFLKKIQPIFLNFKDFLSNNLVVLSLFFTFISLQIFYFVFGFVLGAVIDVFIMPILIMGYYNSFKSNL
ncbi:MAG: hypothetical protein QXF12_06865 [Candidatus Aenigmatarchaeota archaeon]